MLEETVVSPLAFLVNMLAMVALGALGGRGTCSLATLCTSVRNVRAFLGMAADALSFNMKAKICVSKSSNASGRSDGDLMEEQRRTAWRIALSQDEATRWVWR